MSDRQAVVLVPIVIITALALLNGCASTGFYWAVQAGDVSKVKKYIDEGADVEGGELPWRSETPLQMAVRGGYLQMAKLLIEEGANVDAMIIYTPLMIASEAGDIEMARLLIQSGASINMSNNFKDEEIRLPNTALMAAARNQHSEVVQLLIDSGADALYVGADGDSALDWAFSALYSFGKYQMRKMLETVVILVQAGADGRGALELARSDDNTVRELAKMLREVGAPNSRQLASHGGYYEISEYLKDWTIEESIPTE